jgi:Acyl-CoA dehydrogenase, C-terminal domain/Acyl-CoA dehydrogenase, N-terminal domain
MFEFNLSPDQEQIVAALSSTLRGNQQRGASADGLQDLGPLGWIGVGISEEVAGAGGTIIEEALVARELGRWLVTPEVLCTQMAAHIAFRAGDVELATSFVEARHGAGALLPDRSPNDITRSNKANLVDTQPRSHYWSADGQRFSIFEQPFDVKTEVCSSMDASLRLARVDTPGLVQCCSYEDAGGALQRRWQVLIAGMLVGIAEATCDSAVSYAKERKQFGRPIGAFQAIKHRCADMHVRARLANAQTMLAGMVEAHGLTSGTQHAGAALLVAIDGAVRNGEAAIQIHGGLGFSEECVAHRYLKRAHLLRILVGGGVHSNGALLAAVKADAQHRGET